MEFTDVIRERFSVRAYADRPIEPEKLYDALAKYVPEKG